MARKQMSRKLYKRLYSARFRQFLEPARTRGYTKAMHRALRKLGRIYPGRD